MRDLFETCQTHSIDLPSSYEIVLELYPDETCGYYAVDNDRETVFFLDPADTADLGLPDVVSKNHLGESFSHIVFGRHHDVLHRITAAPTILEAYGIFSCPPPGS